MVEGLEQKCHRVNHDGVKQVLLKEEEDTEMTGGREVAEVVVMVEEVVQGRSLLCLNVNTGIGPIPLDNGNQSCDKVIGKCKRL